MDKIDIFIRNTIKNEFELPQSYNNVIWYTLKKKSKIKKYKYIKLLKTICTTCVGIILSTGFVFAGYTMYERVWKEPKIYNSLEEKITDEKAISEENNKEKFETNEIISNQEAVSIFSNILSNLGISQNISEENIKINTELYSQYFSIETNEYTIDISANGIFQNFINKSFDYTIKCDDITEKKATEFANKIIESINLNNKYTLNNIESTVSLKNGNTANIWFASYYQEINGLKNKYNCINLSFYVVNNRVIIESIITLDNDFEFQDNEVLITKEEALKIAKDMDRKISVLDINSCDAELAIERLNSFVYIQEQTLGKEDEIKEEIIDGVGNTYYGYSNEKILRIVWKVKIDYNYNASNARNENEYRGRYYYIDATTGEIIGGSWGKLGY
jgi:hypothetical protein